MKVAVLGASDDPERYSYKAVSRLLEAGHTVFPVHPKLKEVLGLSVHSSLKDLPETADTITVYVSPAVSSAIASDILGSGARRLIFNPGSENPELAAKARAAGIHTVEACTLVLLSTRQFEKA